LPDGAATAAFTAAASAYFASAMLPAYAVCRKHGAAVAACHFSSSSPRKDSAYIF